MKLYVKRKEDGLFEKGMVVLETIDEWTYLSLACMWQAEEYKKNIEKFKKKGWDSLESMKDSWNSINEKYEMFKQFSEMLSFKNEIEWDGKTIE